MAKRIRMSIDDANWQAEMDAKTLADAAAINSDAKRLSAAKKAAKSQYEAAMKSAQRYNSIAGSPRKKTK